jgi:hypothetical protein
MSEQPLPQAGGLPIPASAEAPQCKRRPFRDTFGVPLLVDNAEQSLLSFCCRHPLVSTCGSTRIL